MSDRDEVAAVSGGAQPSVAPAAATEPLAVSADQRLGRAARLMTEHGVSHLVVLDAADGHPIGVLSTRGLAAVHAQKPELFMPGRPTRIAERES